MLIKEKGRSDFQDRDIRRSYRIRGKVPRVQMKKDARAVQVRVSDRVENNGE